MTKIQYWNYQLPQRAVDLPYADEQTHLLDMTNVIILMSRLSPTQVPIHKGRDSHK